VLTKLHTKNKTPWNSYIIQNYNGSWAFHITDGVANINNGAVDHDIIEANKWTHLVGVYDGTNNQ